MRLLISAVGIAALGVFASCGGNSATVGGASSGTSGSSGGSGLAGVWDIAGSSTGGARPTTGTLQIDASTFILTLDDATLSAKAAGDQLTLTWQQSGRVTTIATTHTGAPLSLGVVPIAFAGGTWSFSGTNSGGTVPRCSSTVAPDTFTGQCVGVTGTPSVVGRINGTITGKRNSRIDSVFGDLGGDWTLTSGAITISALFSGSRFTTTVTGQQVQGGTLTVTVGDGVVSGSTDTGVEFSAHRR